jgi:hypothetical protein
MIDRQRRSSVEEIRDLLRYGDLLIRCDLVIANDRIQRLAFLANTCRQHGEHVKHQIGYVLILILKQQCRTSPRN